MEISVDCASEFVEPLSEIFNLYGGSDIAVEAPGGFNPDEGERVPDSDLVIVRTYLPLDSDSQRRFNSIDLAVRLLSKIGNVSEIREQILTESDWMYAWKEHFQVLKIGHSIRVVPSWCRYDRGVGDVVVELDPGAAFGTGHHPTTLMCIELLEKVVNTGSTVLDVGCGSGILSIVSSGLGAVEVIGLEIDPCAAKVAKINVDRNGADESVTIFHGTLPYPEVLRSHYEVVVANISSKVITELAEELMLSVKPGGRLIVSGFLSGAIDDIRRSLEKVGGNFVHAESREDWVAIVVGG